MALKKEKNKIQKKKTAKVKNTFKPLLSNSKKPQNLTIFEWQSQLRRQAAERLSFKITNIGEGLVYSDYKIYNNTTKNFYKVALRSSDNSLNYCSCYDFKTNQLGTCKHIEAVLQYINKKPALRKALAQKYQPPYSSMYMEYRGERKIMFRVGADNAVEYQKLLKSYLSKNRSLNERGYNLIHKILQKAFQINPSFRYYEDALEHIIQLRENKQRHELLAPYLKTKKLPNIKSLKVKPFPYQTEGILFCAIAGRSILGRYGFG
ncbi:MAG: SWIM zinc finger family protein [Ferruginibacter sp.]